MANRQTILVTGATGNVGGGAALALAKRGARVVLLGRKQETLEARASSIRSAASERGSQEIDWDDLESIRNHKTTVAYNRTKTCNRAIAAELARRYAGRISFVAFDPAFIIDKDGPELKKRWPSGFMGFFWSMMAAMFAKPPLVAGEPIAELMLLYPDRSAINGALFKLDKRVEKPDKAMTDEVLGKRLWDTLVQLTELSSRSSVQAESNRV